MNLVDWYPSSEQRSVFFNIFIHLPVNKADDKHKGSLSIYSFYSARIVPFVLPIKKGTNHLNSSFGGFPGGAVVKNLPANAGDTGLSPGPGRSHMLWSN